MKHLGITPDGIIGHSTGEIACAYADGCLTTEEVLKSGFYRGKAIDDANLPEGGMIAVGVSWSEAQRICPEGCYPACDNADDSVTISGLKEPLEKFTEKLKQDNVFFRWVNSHGYTFHCEHVRPSAGPLKSSLSK
ncbi:fatty acid synthase, partial [Trichonephila inaurata madagascariensis]